MRYDSFQCIISSVFGEEDGPRAIVELLEAIGGEFDGNSGSIEKIETSGPTESSYLYAIRPTNEVGDDLAPAWFCESNNAGSSLYTAEGWADAVRAYAKEHGWDSEEEPAIPTASDRAGVHQATGNPYEPSAEIRIEADAEAAQCRLFREIEGLLNASDRT